MPVHFVDARPETDCRVYVNRTERNVWMAVGTFMDKHLSAKGNSELNALNNWIKVAESRSRSS